ncbi:MAG: rhomboid family intramembrane serine protease [Flavobacteriales bacterium]
MNLWKDLQSKYRHGDIVLRLVLINLGVFVVLNIYLTIYYFLEIPYPSFLGDDLTLSASSDWSVMLHRPWSLLTHMFTHEDFGHVFFNMLALYFMGGLLWQLLGTKTVLTSYFLGGLSGFTLFFIAFNTMERFQEPGGSFIIGASAAVMGITMTAAAFAPQMPIRIFGVLEMKLIWVGLSLLLLDLFSIRYGVNSGGHIAHIGGAAFGYFYGWNLRTGKSMFKWFESIMQRLGNLLSRKKKMRVTVNHARPKSDEEYNQDKKLRQERIDFILDKIGKSGYESLSKDEKEFLFRHSQK